MTETRNAGCYEAFLSPRQAKETYLLNKCSGAMWNMLNSKEGLVWDAIPREPAEGASNSSDHGYQLIVSGMTARDTFLLDTKSGTTWQLVEGKKGLVLVVVPRN